MVSAIDVLTLINTAAILYILLVLYRAGLLSKAAIHAILAAYRLATMQNPSVADLSAIQRQIDKLTKRVLKS